MAIYPNDILAQIERIRPRQLTEPTGRGRAASFECGCMTEFEIEVDGEKRISAVSFRSNGCGYMLAAAAVIARTMEGTDLRTLHGTAREFVEGPIEDVFGFFPQTREHCIAAVCAAFRGALADHRTRSAAEFRGETALICTCFGVTEDRIEKIISDDPAADIDRIGVLTNAGTGCGSCRSLIEEMISG